MFIFNKPSKEGVIEPAKELPKEIVVPHLDYITDGAAYSTYYSTIKQDAKALKDLLLNFEGVSVNDDGPFATLKQDKAEPYIHIYPNFKWHYKEETFEVDFSIFKIDLKPAFVESFKASYNVKIEDRVWQVKAPSIILKTQELSIEQFLVRYTNSTSFLKDSEIRDMAHKIKCGLIMYDLMVCDTPQDYYNMFLVQTGSCMSRPKNSKGVQGHSTDTWDIAHELYGLHPGSWYHWTKSSKGCYLVNKLTRTPVARAMIYSNREGNFTMYGDIKHNYSSGATKEAMIKALSNHGFIDSWPGYWKVTEEFRVPSFALDGTLKCPYPFGDNIFTKFAVDYDEATDEFIFKPSMKDAPYRYSYGGFMSREDVYKFNGKEVPAKLHKAA